MDQWIALPITAAMLGSGIVSGVFFAFSTFVMRGLARLDARGGILAMQSINVTVICPPFMGVFLGTGLLSVGAVALALFTWERPESPYLLAAGLSYFVGNILVTGLGNVPLNDALARLSPDEAEASGVWDHYVSRWTDWNHVRTLSGILATALYLLALMRLL